MVTSSRIPRWYSLAKTKRGRGGGEEEEERKRDIGEDRT
jgi:hypothetical protein